MKKPSILFRFAAWIERYVDNRGRGLALESYCKGELADYEKTALEEWCKGDYEKKRLFFLLNKANSFLTELDGQEGPIFRERLPELKRLYPKQFETISANDRLQDLSRLIPVQLYRTRERIISDMLAWDRFNKGMALVLKAFLGVLFLTLVIVIILSR